MGSGREQALEPAQRASGPAPLVKGLSWLEGHEAQDVYQT